LFTLATNPFRHVDGVYGPDNIRLFHDDADGEIINRAHVYSVVEKAYRGMSGRQVDQSILVSGMSGSGKSETVKICINYLSSIGDVGISSSSSSSLEKRINDAGLVLESFGNSFTVHNSNSSRFGKYTKMFFEHGKAMVGARITTYLLEKTRVAHPPKNERNFHIFYQLLHGLSIAQKQSLHLKDVNDYQILRYPANSAAAEAEQTKIDVQTYSDLITRLAGLGFDEEALGEMNSILAAILHLGNVTFGENQEKSTPTSSDANVLDLDDGISYVDDMTPLNLAATLLGVEALALETAFTKLSVKNVSNAVLPLSRAKAELSRDSLMGELYERLFEWIVSSLNETLGSEIDDEDELGYIAILDISGYESVAKNGFEQININYTNDKLMQLYNELLYNEQEEYKREFSWDPIEFDTDLKDTIALIERKPEGVLPLLDAVCYRQDASDKVFVNELGAYTIGTPRANVRCIHGVNPELLKFCVHHAPGPIEYEARGFVVKNRDILAASLELLMRSSTLALLGETLFSFGEESHASALVGNRSRRQQQQTSVSKFYIEQLSDLMDAIRETDYSFIKCIKPNSQNKPNLMDKEYIADQIKWSGVIETLKVCSRGFPEHVPYDQFVNKFSILIADTLPTTQTTAEAKETSNKILTSSLPIPTANGPQYAFGQSKLYLSMSALFQLITLKKAKEQSQDGWIAKAKSAFGWLWKA
jgi:myosin-5